MDDTEHKMGQMAFTWMIQYTKRANEAEAILTGLSAACVD